MTNAIWLRLVPIGLLAEQVNADSVEPICLLPFYCTLIAADMVKRVCNEACVNLGGCPANRLRVLTGWSEEGRTKVCDYALACATLWPQSTFGRSNM